METNGPEFQAKSKLVLLYFYFKGVKWWNLLEKIQSYYYFLEQRKYVSKKYPNSTHHE